MMQNKPVYSPTLRASSWISYQILTSLLLQISIPPVCSNTLRIPLFKTYKSVNEAALETGDVAGLYSKDISDDQKHNLFGRSGQGYYIEMRIGHPPQTINVLIDTGSSNFAVAAAPHPDIDRYFNISQSSSVEILGQTVDVPYTQGDWKGSIGRDRISLASLQNISFTADIAFITSSSHFYINGSNWQGILGLAYKAIARPDESVEPLFDALVRQTDMPDMFSLQLCGAPLQSPSSVSMDGSLVIGGIADDLYVGPLHYVPIRKEWYYEVIITDILVNGTSLSLNCQQYNDDKTMIDSGTTNLRLPSPVFNALVKQLKKPIQGLVPLPPDGFWTQSDLICWPRGTALSSNFPVIAIHLAASAIASIALNISPHQYLKYVPDELGVTLDKDCYRFSISPSQSGSVLGAVVMEGFYIVFDRRNKTIGFAATSCQRVGSSRSSVTGPQFSKFNTADCAHRGGDILHSMTAALWVLVIICSMCVVTLTFLGARWIGGQCSNGGHASVTQLRPRSDVDNLISE